MERRNAAKKNREVKEGIRRKECKSMQSCGRIRKEIEKGWSQITEGELQNLEMGVLSLEEGEEYTLHTGDREYAIVLIQGDCEVSLESGLAGILGPRHNPFEDMPFGLFLSRDETITFSAKATAVLGIGYSPAERKMANTLVTPAQVATAVRGSENWTREVRKVCWSDNTEGNLLIAGETCTPSGNWSTVPPHRHQYDVEGEEAPYEEIYFFQFSHPKGFGLIWQFDDEGDMDQAFSLKANDAAYMDHGYHPVACGPGSTLYQLTFMAGPRRISRASIHKDYRFLLDEKNLVNQYTPDLVGGTST
jgi:5-deoxy-glucuronate isomerase